MSLTLGQFGMFLKWCSLKSSKLYTKLGLRIIVRKVSTFDSELLKHTFQIFLPSNVWKENAIIFLVSIDKNHYIWKDSKLLRLQMELKRLEKFWMWRRKGERIIALDIMKNLLIFTWFWGYFCENILRKDQNGIYTGPTTDGVCSPCPVDSNSFCKTNYFLRIVFKKNP